MDLIRYPYLLCLLVLFSPFQIKGQKSFELANTEALQLDERNLPELIGTFWVSVTEDMLVRNDTITTSSRYTRTYIEYFPDQTFEFNGKFGSWVIIEGKYIRHALSKTDYEKQLNFGGTFSVTELGDSTLTLVKILTSSSDMKRTIYFKAESREEYFRPFLTASNKPIRPTKKKKTKPTRVYKNLTPFLLEPDLKEFKRISKLRTDELLHYGFDFKGDTIYIQIKDSLYRLRRRTRD